MPAKLRPHIKVHKSPELALWESTKEGAEQVASKKIYGTPTGSGIKQ